MIGLVAGDIWRELLDVGGLNVTGLAMVRVRLAEPEQFGLLPSPKLDLLALDVDQALADALGLDDPALLPGRAPIGDYPADEV